MELVVLGFRVGAPLEGACPCYAVRGGDGVVLLDFGPGALERAWATGILGDVRAIVVSHMHMDHCLDLLPLSGELTQMALRERYPERPRPLLCVPRDGGVRALELLASAVSSARDRFDRSFELREYDERDRVEAGGLELTFSRTVHPAVCFAARASDGRVALVYGADGAFSEELVRFAAGAELLLLEATFVEAGPDAERTGHMTGELAAAVAERAGAHTLLLTHFGPSAELAAENLRLARARFSGDVALVREGAVHHIGAQRAG